ncbi:DUF2182 domain-containing protein [Mesorhizobium sp. M0848]|uniref:copper chaperone n=1 Tax=Mesorhizobium sp. M0848 TaxID=2957012 RepID=UPI00333D6266
MLTAAAGMAASSTLNFHADLPSLCGTTAADPTFEAVVGSLRFIIATNPLSSLVLAWLAMLAAMMTPLIALPLSHVRASSLATRRWRASAAFILGYFGVLVLAGIPLLALAFTIRLLADSALTAFIAATVLALVWSASPFHQAAQNRAHRLRRIGVFGLTADRDCIAFGSGLGKWCLASCWPWMLVPMFVSSSHIPVMIAVLAIVMGERIRGPGPLDWRVPIIRATQLAWMHERFHFFSQSQKRSVFLASRNSGRRTATHLSCNI